MIIGYCSYLSSDGESPPHLWEGGNGANRTGETDLSVLKHGTILLT
ncbi:MAG: hypothetical protein QNJ34_12595 [Xenococcaceae cyanobacterium MO_188.B29]|nr:hypothetical protein [Xenococcaceae cyanobacterium MO_188.B29]